MPEIDRDGGVPVQDPRAFWDDGQAVNGNRAACGSRTYEAVPVQRIPRRARRELTSSFQLPSGLLLVCCKARVLGIRARLFAAAGALLLFAAPAVAAPPDPLEVPHKKVLVTTTINAGPELTATLTEFFTGEKKEKTAIDMVLGLHRVVEGKRTLLSSRDYNAETGGFVSRGSLLVIDLDRDGTNEILVEYHHNELPGSTRVDLDVLRIVGDRLVLTWNGPLRLDTTAPSFKAPPAERDRFVREIDYARTSASGGLKIAFKKTVSVAAGAVFDPPRVVLEDVDLRAPKMDESPVK